MVLRNVTPEVRGASRELVVLVHAIKHGIAGLADVRQAVRDALPNADLLVPEYQGGVLSSADPLEITQELIQAIDDAILARAQRVGAYDRLVLIGHSLGGLLVRKAYVFARGQNQDQPGPLRSRPKIWPPVDRIILMAGMNRGWQIETRPRHMPRWRWYSFRLGAGLYRWFRMGRLLNSVRRGAPFVANLRVQWLNLVRDGESPPPPTIQLLGTIDDIVCPEDNVDVQSGAQFIYKRVPNTGHASVVQFGGVVGEVRRGVFLKCLTVPIQAIHSDAVVPLERDHTVDRLVFIMHGIRDYGFWTRDVAKKVEALAAATAQNPRTVTSSYGFFPMLGFLLQPERQAKVRWFMDQYTEALARYPCAKISFIGHSNGTYLLASALRRYAACAFDRVVFAGSVIPRSFPWDQMVGNSRVASLQNYVATRDAVVAIFPALFEMRRRPDLGSGGHNGFTDHEGQRHAVTFIKGGHSAALRRENLETLARFSMGEDVSPASGLVADERFLPVVLASKFCVFIWLLLIVAAGALVILPVVRGGLGWWWPPVSAVLLYFVLRRV